MGNQIFENSDEEMLIVVQQGTILITTELGKLTIQPNFIAVIPRGIKFKIDLVDCFD